MSESAQARPSTRVFPHELPASLRDAGLDNWIREALAHIAAAGRRIDHESRSTSGREGPSLRSTGRYRAEPMGVER